MDDESEPGDVVVVIVWPPGKVVVVLTAAPGDVVVELALLFWAEFWLELPL